MSGAAATRTDRDGSPSFPARTYLVALSGKKDPPKNKKKDKAAIHPNAPAGGGGPGYFKDAHCLNGPTSGDSPACATPPARKHVAPKPDGATAPKVAPKPPPVTAPAKWLLLKKLIQEQDIEVYIEILDDTANPSLASGTAKTSFTFENVTTQTPAYEYVGSKISKLTSKFEIKGTITIQTAYGPGAKPTDISGYGRGTTTEDEKNGNVTLGFHESRHRQDFLNYLHNHPLPQFSGRVGMAVEAFTAAVAKFQTDFDKYQAAVEPFSNSRTDEVGYKESKYDQSGPRKP